MSDEFGRYRLEAKIGDGGLAEVYRAHGSDGQAVALKRLSRAHLDSPELTAVFKTEAATAALMQDPHLVAALDSGDVEGWPFLVMPIAAGGDLGAALKEDRGFAPDLLPKLIADLGCALAAMHKLGYMHGDLSPGNVLFAQDGSAMISDFSSSTQLGKSQPQVQGTFAYMSPEQVRGQGLDERSDVFSLAVLLWHCLTGQRIFWREAQHLCFMAVVEADPPPMPAQYAAVEAVLRVALAKEPGDRHSSAEDLCAAVLAAL